MVWLSPDEQQRFAVLVKRYGSKTQAFRVMLGREG